MRKDTQIGLILGVVILGIIAVFLSTRTDVNKQFGEEISYDNKNVEDKKSVKVPEKK